MFYTVDDARDVSVRLSRTESFSVEESLLKHSDIGREYDVFLSHSFADRRVLHGVIRIIESQGVSVYVDWRDDPLLERQHVTATTAERLRQRMHRCRALIFATSETSSKSVWMPWELGYFDGRKAGRVAVMPLTKRPNDIWDGQEYLGLYPVVERHALGGHVHIVSKSNSQARWSSVRSMAGHRP
ncbi:MULTISPECIES: hypothetical protein [unclassified Aeromicrobium]|uniref:hypothetical protein n=1 Tax=unclassified Aeromicrobium TaxID=2633570 RepID=UPI0028892092|nr:MULTISPECIES: hypothetical protein [unclassified Aeromicrobium]